MDKIYEINKMNEIRVKKNKKDELNKQDKQDNESQICKKDKLFEICEISKIGEADRQINLKLIFTILDPELSPAQPQLVVSLLGGKL